MITSRILEHDYNTLTVLTVSKLGDQLPELLCYQGISRLTTLNLEQNEVGNIGARAIANSAHFANLTALELGNDGIGEAGAEAIADSPHLANLTILDLSGNNIGDSGTRTIARSSHLTRLNALKLAVSHDHPSKKTTNHLLRGFTRRKMF